MVGCGVGSGCGSVTGSRWAYFLGNVPVSLPALVLYVVMLICSLFYEGKGKDAASLDRLIQPLLLVLAGSVVGSALWFSWLQAGVLHSFCKYCALLHCLGCISAILILIHCRRPGLPVFSVGLAAAALFAFVQAKTLPDVLYDSGRTDSDLPSFNLDDVYSLGPDQTETTFTLLFDFQCEHCRKLHKLLPSVCSSDGIRVLLCPVPLSSACNPYIPDGIDRFAGSCRITKAALAVWYACPDRYPEFESFLMDGEFCPSPEEAEAEAAKILGNDSLPASAQDICMDAPQNALQIALQDPRIDSYLDKVYELFGRTSSAGKGAVPRLIYGQQWMVVEAETAESLSALLSSLL